MAFDNECLPDVTVGRKRSRKRLRTVAVLVIVILLMMMGYTLGLVALGVSAKAAGVLAGVLVTGTIKLTKWIITVVGQSGPGGATAPAPVGGS